MQVNRVCSDEMISHLAISDLDAEALTEVSDILRAPPEQNKYESSHFERMPDSSDQQLQRKVN